MNGFGGTHPRSSELPTATGTSAEYGRNHNCLSAAQRVKRQGAQGQTSVAGSFPFLSADDLAATSCQGRAELGDPFLKLRLEFASAFQERIQLCLGGRERAVVQATGALAPELVE